MAVAFLQEFPPSDDRSTTNYDAIAEKLRADGTVPEGLLIHSAGFGEDGAFRIYDVWESREQCERFQEERLMPAVREVLGEDMGGAPPPKQQVYELHDVIVPGS